MKKTIVAIVVILALSHPALSHEGWVSYLVDNQEYHINDIAIEGDFVWCATLTGLLRYNASTGETQRFTTDDGLPSNTVTDVLVDENGMKWMATSEGVSRFDGETWKSFGKDDFFHGYDINDITVDTRGVTWFSTDIGVFSYDYHDETWQNYDEVIVKRTRDEAKFEIRDVKSSAVDSLGVVWFGTDGLGVFSYDGENWQEPNKTVYDEENTAFKLQNNKIISINVDENNIKYFCTTKFYYTFDDNEWLRYLYVESPLKYSAVWRNRFTLISAMITGPNNDLWLGSNDIDDEGPAYINAEGLAHMQDGDIAYYNESNGLPYNSVTTLALDTNDILWIGTERGLAYYVEGELHKTSLCISPYSGTVSEITFDRENVAWMAGHGRTFYYDGNDFRGFELVTGECLDIESDYDNITYFVDRYGAVYRHENDELLLIYENVGESSGDASDIAIDKHNTVWMAIDCNPSTFADCGIGCYCNNAFSMLYWGDYYLSLIHI